MLNLSLKMHDNNFAIKFISLEDDSEIIYMNSEFYAPKSELTLFWNDKTVSIEWPIDPIFISNKDQNALELKEISKLLL